MLLAIAVTASFAPGCARTITHYVDRATTDHLLPFLKDGDTNRSEILDHLGRPLRSFDPEHIATYRLRMTDGQLVAVTKDEEAIGPYELILAFDERHILIRHTLIRWW